METVTDIKISEQTVNRWLKQLKTESVDIYPGYISGLVLPKDTPLGIILTTPIIELLPLCKFDKRRDMSVFFTIFPTGKDNQLFEISYKTSGKYVYKNNKKFVNQPQFDELFDAVWQIQKQKITANPTRTDLMTYKHMALILNFLRENDQVK